jgi:hypothetical protein
MEKAQYDQTDKYIDALIHKEKEWKKTTKILCLSTSGEKH